MYAEDVRRAFRVGLFVVGGLALAALVLLTIRDWRLMGLGWGWGAGYELRVRFADVAGLKVGAPVRYAGVEVGQVTAIRLVWAEPTPTAAATATDAGAGTETGRGALVEVALRLPRGVRVREGDQVWIGMLGLLGEKYVEITPTGRGRVLEPGAVLEGHGVVSETRLAQQVGRTLEGVEATLEGLNELALEPEALERRLKELEALTEEARRLLARWRAVGEEGERLLQDVRRRVPSASLALTLGAAALAVAALWLLAGAAR